MPMCVYVCMCFLSWMQEPGKIKVTASDRPTDVPLQILMAASNMAERTKASPVILLPLQPDTGTLCVWYT